MKRSRRLGAGLVAAIVVALMSFVTSGVAGAAGSAGSVVSHRPVHIVAASQSSNWSGYNQGRVEKGKKFTSVSATWVVPTASPHVRGENEYSSAWVGIGGGCLDVRCNSVDNTLIQAGTGHVVHANGSKSYYAWYELIPATETRVALGVRPGQRVNVTVQQTSPNFWSISIRNLSSGKTFTTTTRYLSTYATAEWVLETPTLITGNSQRLAQLPKLTPLRFRSATVNGAAANLAAKEEIRLVRGGQVLADPSRPANRGTAFNDCTYTTFCAAP